MIKLFTAKIFAWLIHNKNKRWIDKPLKFQRRIFKELIKNGSLTEFGKEHNFDKIKNFNDFQLHVPVRDYEGLRPFVERILNGKSYVLWPGKPLYFAKTSGTTSGVKYIPITKASMPTHITAARDALLNYIFKTGNSDFVNGKQIFLQGSPVLEKSRGVIFGRLSGIVAHYVPRYLQKSRMPSWDTNCIENWEDKVDAIVNETISENMTLIAGIPSWVQMYFEKLIEKSNVQVGEIFKNFSLFVHGGVNYQPYKAIFEKLVGRKVDSIELFPASEGFFAYQDQPNKKGLLLLVNNGIFYEFIKSNEFHNKNPKRYHLGEVKLGVNYLLIISTYAGLWGYNIGDTIMFTSLSPYRLVVTGRIKHFISAFGEHVISKEVETAIEEVCKGTPVQVKEFTVAPQITPNNGLPHHEWFIEFGTYPKKIKEFADKLDKKMQEKNIYYRDLIIGKVLCPLIITEVAPSAFRNYMKSIGKLGGQNKIPRLSNDRKIVDQLSLK